VASGLSVLRLGARTIQNSEINRRKFLKLIAAGSVIGSSWLVAFGTGANMWMRKDESFDTSHLTGIDKELAEIYNPYSDFLVRGRNRNMFLNETATANIDLRNDLENIQLAFAAGHLGKLRYYTVDREDVEQEARGNALSIVSEHIRSIKQHRNDSNRDEQLAKIAVNLSLYFAYHMPVTMLVNNEATGKNLELMRQQHNGEETDKSAHLILMETLQDIESRLQNREFSNDEEENSDINLVLAYATELTQNYWMDRTGYLRKDGGGEVGLAGDPNKIDRTIEVWGTKTNFSAGLTAKLG